MIETTNHNRSTPNSANKSSKPNINGSQIEFRGNLQIIQKFPQQEQYEMNQHVKKKQDQKKSLAGPELSTILQTQSQISMSSGSESNNGSNQQKGLNNNIIYIYHQQNPKDNSKDLKAYDKHGTPNNTNNKENIISGQNTIETQINQNNDMNLSQRQQLQQQMNSSQNINKRNDSLVNDDANLNHTHPKMIVTQDIQVTQNGGFGDNTNSQVFDGNESQQQQAVYQRIQFLREQIQSLEDHDSLLQFFKSYSVHNADIITVEEIVKSENVKLKRYKQSVYFGEMMNNQRCGKGLMVYNNGRAYEGDWQNDYKFGRGFELYPNGNRYEGYFVNGKSEGMGTYVWANNEIYDGQWLGGMKHGSGMWRGPKGDSYIGEWKFGKADGYGVHTWVNGNFQQMVDYLSINIMVIQGDRYEGQFKVCLKHGEGTEKFANGDFYQGQYVNGRPEGYGEYTWQNNSHYKGTFKNGLRHGKGIWRRNLNELNSDRYEGEYQNDKKCGFGVFKWSSGNEFRGNYFDDLRHGYGEMFWTDGSYYKGNWERGIQSGEGELYMPGEGIKRGLFVNNIFKGSYSNDEDQFVNKQQMNLQQYNQQQQLFRESSKFRISPHKLPTTSKQQNSKSALKKEIPQQLTKMGSISPNSMNSSFRKTPIKSSLKKKLPELTDRNSGRIQNKSAIRFPQERNNKSHLPNSRNNKSYHSFIQDENTQPRSNKAIQTVETTINNPFYQKDDNHDQNTDRNYNQTLHGGNSSRIYDKYKDTSGYLRNSYTEEDQNFRDKNFDDRRNKHGNEDILSKSNYQQPNNKIYKNNSNTQGLNPLNKRRSISVSGNRQNYYTPNSLMRNSSVTPNPHKNMNYNQNNKSERIHLPQINNPYSNDNKHFNGKKQKQILLKKHEIILWRNLRPKLHLRKGMYKDFTDPLTVQKIRTLLHPPIWKPAGISNLDYSPERDQSMDRLVDIDHNQSYLFLNQARFKSHHN